MPPISRDLTDRNRTSPFAFTGNKFEFRAVGAKQSPSFPIVVLNAAVASSLREVEAALVKQKGSKAVPSEEDQLAVIKEYIKKSKAIRFEGNNYSQEWVQEAERRGLPNIRQCPPAFRMLMDPTNSEMLKSLGICSSIEIKSRYHIMMERYVKDLLIEANTLKSMIFQHVLPAVYEYRKSLADSLKSMKEVGASIADAPEKKTLDAVAKFTSELTNASERLVALIQAIVNEGDLEKEADLAAKEVIPLFDEIREKSDAYVDFFSYFSF